MAGDERKLHEQFPNAGERRTEYSFQWLLYKLGHRRAARVCFWFKTQQPNPLKRREHQMTLPWCVLFILCIYRVKKHYVIVKGWRLLFSWSINGNFVASHSRYLERSMRYGLTVQLNEFQCFLKVLFIALFVCVETKRMWTFAPKKRKPVKCPVFCDKNKGEQIPDWLTIAAFRSIFDRDRVVWSMVIWTQINTWICTASGLRLEKISHFRMCLTAGHKIRIDSIERLV